MASIMWCWRNSGVTELLSLSAGVGVGGWTGGGDKNPKYWIWKQSASLQRKSGLPHLLWTTFLSVSEPRSPRGATFNLQRPRDDYSWESFTCFRGLKLKNSKLSETFMELRR